MARGGQPSEMTNAPYCGFRFPKPIIQRPPAPLMLSGTPSAKTSTPSHPPNAPATSPTLAMFRLVIRNPL